MHVKPTAEKNPHPVHPLIRINYLPRALGFPLIFLIMLTIYPDSRNPLLWVLLLAQCFLWPHIAYQLGKRSARPLRTEYANMYFEAAVCGFWISMISFQLWPSTAFFIGILFNLISTGGLRHMLRAIPFLLLGIAIGVLVLGFRFTPDSGLVTAVTSIAFIIVYSTIVSLTSYRYASSLYSSRKRLKAANDELESTRDRLWGEMQLAKKIQTILLPPRPAIPGFEIAAYMQPADEVGGDYYDIINVEGCDWLVIGDVSGHGVPAGLIMMMVQTSIHTALASNPDLRPEELLKRVNRVITENIRRLNEDKYMTITVLAYLKNGEFFFSGLHQDILVYRAASKSVDVVETDGIWIGLMSDISRVVRDSSLELGNGDVMLLYTDGITEAWHADSVQDHRDAQTTMFGAERLRAALAELGGGKPEAIRDGILERLRDYRPTDDVTLLIAKKTS